MATNAGELLYRLLFRSWFWELVEWVFPPGHRILKIRRVAEASGMAGQTTPAPEQLRAVRRAVARSRRKRVSLDEFMEDSSLAWREYERDHGVPGRLVLKGIAIDHLDETLARVEGRAL